MKRLLILISALLLLGASASAAVYTFDCKDTASVGALAAFDQDGKLTGVTQTSLTKKSGKLVSDDISLSGDTVKLFLPDSKTIIEGVLHQEEAPATPDYDSELYPKEEVALYAPALVKKVHEIYNNGDSVYELTLLYQGNEFVYTADSELLITVASDSYSEALNQNAAYLKAGDVIVLNYLFKDYPSNICLIYRPNSTEPVFNSEITSFLPLYTNNTLVTETWSTSLKEDISYNFGVVTDVTEDSLAICEKSGMSSSVKYIPFHENAAVYLYDMTDKSKTEICGVGGIYKSFIPDEALDSSENIADWSKTDDRAYTLVRAADGIAVDIIIYKY